eukprot:9266979-Pyramimonas_sp.AAC.1
MRQRARALTAGGVCVVPNRAVAMLAWKLKWSFLAVRDWICSLTRRGSRVPVLAQPTTGRRAHAVVSTCVCNGKSPCWHAN